MREMKEKDSIAGVMKCKSKGENIMQEVVKFRVAESEIAQQINDYIEDNSGVTIVSMVTVSDGGDEAVLALVDDGQ